MNSDTAISIIGIAVNIIGFFFLSRQLRMQALATRGETYTSLCGLSYDILKLITEEPFLLISISTSCDQPHRARTGTE